MMGRAVRRFRYEGVYGFYPTILPEMDYSINPYFGCEIGCRYCYSIYYFKVKKIGWRWGGYVEAKVYLPRILSRGLNRFKRDAVIGIGTYSDPYQPWEAKLKLTRRIIRILRRRPDLHLSIQTRYPLVLRDMDLILAGKSDVGTSIPSIEKWFMDIFEPLVPSPRARLRMLERFSKEGVETWLYIAPIMPYINDDPEMVDELIGMAVEYGVKSVYTDILRFRLGVREYIVEVLMGYDEALARKYMYLGRAELFRRYSSFVERVRRLASKYGIEYVDAMPMMFNK